MRPEVTAVALVGVGRMGAIHGRNAAANPRLRLARVVDADAGRAREAARAWAAEASSLEDALADDSIRGLIVANPTDAHLETCLAALRAGKAVFCEKPLDLDLARLRAAAEVLERPARPLFVGFNRRFDPHYRALRERVASGAIGGIESIHIVNHDPAPPPLDFIPRSGGLLRDFTIHDFDMAAWLLGEPVAEVFAWAACLVDPRIAELGDVDTAKLVLRTATGRLCMISNSRRAAHGYDQRLEVFGSKGAARVDNVTRTQVGEWTAGGMRSDAIHPAFPERYADSYAAEVDHFAAILAGEASPAAGYLDNVRALALADAASRSIDSGAPIRIQPT